MCVDVRDARCGGKVELAVPLSVEDEAWGGKDTKKSKPTQ